jgi:hypothetical protein
MKARNALRGIAIIAALFACCWLFLLLVADSPVVNRQALHRSLEAGLVRDSLKLVEQHKQELTFLRPDEWPPSVAALKPDKVIASEYGVCICMWAAGYDKFQQSITIHITVSDKPPCFPSNPVGMEYCERVAEKVFIHYSPARLKDGKASLLTKLQAHFQKGTFKYTDR